MEEEIKTGEGATQETAPENTTATEGEPKPESADEGVKEPAEQPEAKTDEPEQVEEKPAPKCIAVEVIDSKGEIVKVFSRDNGDDFVADAKAFAQANGCRIGYR